MKVTIIFLLLFLSCNSTKEFDSSIEELLRLKEIENKECYELGKVVAVQAMLRLRIRQLETGKDYTNKEVYALADNISGFYLENIKLLKPSKE